MAQNNIQTGSAVANSINELDKKASSAIEFLDSVVPSINSPNEVQKISQSGELQFLTSYEISNEIINNGTSSGTT